MGEFAEAAAALSGGSADAGASSATPTSGGSSAGAGAQPAGGGGGAGAFGGARVARPAVAPAASPVAPTDSNEFKQLQQRYNQLHKAMGWLPQQHAQPIQKFYQAYTSDPLSALANELIHQLKDNPVNAQRFMSLAGSHLGLNPPEEDSEPTGGDFMLPDRSATFTSDRAMAERLAWREKQLERKFNDALKPLQEFMQEQRATQLESAIGERANRTAEALFDEAKGWYGFEEHKAEIGKAFAQLSQRFKPTEAFHRAYHTVMQAELRRLAAQPGQAKAQTLLAKPGATTLNPARPSAVPPGTRPSSFREAAERLFGRKAS